MTDRAEVQRAVESARSKPERIRFIGALIARETGNEVIIVGGSAVEVYTSGRTSSLDIDVVTRIRDAARALESWGFARRSGRLWTREVWGIDIDLLGVGFTGSRRLLRRFETPYGPVLLAGVEDLVAKRLVELKHWDTSPTWRADLERQVTILIAEYNNQFDEEYLAFIAKRDDIVDILSDFRRHVGG